MKKSLMILSCSMLLLLRQTVFAIPLPSTNDIQIQGQVFDDQDNTPLVGVSIRVKNGNKGVTTDQNGKFVLSVPEEATLVVTYVGYDSKELKAAASLSIKLSKSNKGLNEVVVIGYGTTRKKNLVGAVSSIGESQIRDRPITRIDQALAAQMPGVQVQSVTGAPGAALQIRVRGAASVSGSNDPLYIVDGVPVDDLGDIDPATIQSVDVLKDASAAAIYGARGSNGVVLITTKRGKLGKARINFSATFARQEAERFVPMMSANEWIQFKKDLIDSSWVARGRTLGKNYQASDDMNFRATELGGTTANTHALANTTFMYDPYWAMGTDSLDYVDWQDAFFKPANMQKYNLSASGGNENVNYLLSGEYLNQDGLAVNTGYKRYTFRSNMEVKLSDFVKVGLQLSPSISWTKGAGIDGRSGIGPSVAGTAPIQEKGVGANSGSIGTPAYRWVADQISPVTVMEETLNNTELVKLLSQIYLNATLAKGLRLNVTGAWNSNSSDNKYYQPTSVTSARRTAVEGSQSTATRKTVRNQYYLFQSLLSYDRIVKKHEFNTVFGASTESNNAANTTQTNKQFANDNLYTFDLGSSTPTASNVTESRRTLSSFFGRINYNYNSRYLLSVSFRGDGSSRFGADSKWGYFPAASVGWRISDEAFMQSIKHVVNDFKIRYSWGIAGNDRIGGDYPAVGLVSTTNYVFGDTQAQSTGFSVTSITNNNLHWEKTTSNDIGFDATILKERFTVSFDYYNKLTKDLLLSVPVARTTGFTKQNANIGSVKNRGYEINLNSRNVTGKNFSWETSLNVSYNKNMVVKLNNDNTPIYTGWENTVKIAVGRPLYTYVLYDAIGVYTSDAQLKNTPKRANTIIGDPIYRDVNKDGVIDASDMTEVGHPDPNYTWGMTNRFAYKRFDLSLLFQGQWGNQIFSMFGRNIDRPTTGLGNYNAKQVWVNRFRSVSQPGDGKTPRIDATTASVYDTRWLYSGAFYKIKNLTAGYTLKPNLIKGIVQARVYFSVDNLWMSDKYTGGYSPEAFQYDYLADWSSYPTARTYSIGINIGL
ncbi:SusC/RagA family TonB-linked outer membrane protein [Chitinophaga oryziterrae]|uniref:SusC/RagA family TonB-linked outer membrane protein n=1 Tax=Chitinophaga oryziterrae TaxID=1031224 RepID=A0A6N8JI24_9BACT|nr:TonB-dependent receptor [Chitinophaga oryziterrae]MVT43986.1 SusC/RagA family TonB-linked outer membrane protein [Chitinophaga oryziterrae]